MSLLLLPSLTGYFQPSLFSLNSRVVCHVSVSDPENSADSLNGASSIPPSLSMSRRSSSSVPPPPVSSNPPDYFHDFGDNLHQRALAERWADFVGPWQKRFEAEKPFFVKVMNEILSKRSGIEENLKNAGIGMKPTEVNIAEFAQERPDIIEDKLRFIDVGAGSEGLEGIKLAQNYPNVVIPYLNEVDPFYRAILEKNLVRKGVKSKVNVTDHYWHEMPFNYRKRFDLLFNLGNGFPYLETHGDQMAALIRFSDLLEDETSRAVIDIRNSSKLKRKMKWYLDRGKSIPGEKFSSTAAPMYNGDEVRSMPIDYDERFNSMLFQYSYTDPERHEKYGDAYLRMSALEVQDMMDLFAHARIDVKNVFGDFKPLDFTKKGPASYGSWKTEDGEEPNYYEFVIGKAA